MRLLPLFLALLTTLLTSACTSKQYLMDQTQIIQSQNDNRHYQIFTLENDLQVLIISDPDTDKAAASLDVFVGSSSDPDNREGLAHFLEHMLFLGTKKYPDPDEYQTFIAQNGGSRNAFTAKEHTNYFFDIKNASLEPMLDRFSQFFIAPAFNPEYVERERNAVNSEYLGKIKTENRRFYAALQQAFNPKSPYAKFSVGDLQTLADRKGHPVRDDLIKFYQQHYSANLMRLVVLANEPLPVLKQWVTDKFSAIPNRHAKKKVFDQPLLTAQQMAQRINIKSLQEKRELTLLFTLPEVQSYYRSKPSAYFQSLLGHEGKGSILALLKEKGWADELSVSPGFSDNIQESSLYLGINLTQAGLKHTDEITDLVFQYIRLLQNTPIQEWIYKEQQRMSELRFRYQEKRNASATVTELARNLQYYAPQDVLRGAYLMEEFRPELTRKLLNQLTPKRVLIALNTQNVPTDQTEAHYQVDYKRMALDPKLIQRWSSSEINPALALPAPNPFIPDELHLKTADSEITHPELIQQLTNFDVWHQLDTSFKVPRSSLYLALHSPSANQTPRESLLSSLLTGIINKQLNSYAYPARLAGLNYSIYPTDRGITLTLSGYDQKQPVLLARILSAFKQPEITKTRFHILKNRYQQSLNNAKQQQPFHQVLNEIKRTLIEHHWTTEQKLAALKDISQNDLIEFSQYFLKQLHLTLLIQGNNTEAEVQQLADAITQQLTLASTPITVPATKVIQLLANKTPTRQLPINNQDAALALYFQAPNKSALNRAENQLLGRIIAPAFFADLRTQQQLGYNLAAAAMPIKDMPGLLFILQSPVISAPEIESRSLRFLQKFKSDLQAMPEQEFASYKSGLIIHLLEKDKSLQKRSYRNWLEIDRNNKYFNTRELIAAAVDEISQQQLVKTYQQWLIDAPRKLRVYSLGNQFAKDDFKDKSLITDIEAFKQTHRKL